jgi:hypothetical protein
VGGFNLPGGDTHRPALNAAFLAARDRSDITMPVVFTAVRTELHKLDRPVHEADFRL